MYLTPAAPLRTVQTLSHFAMNGRLLLARHNAIQMRRTLTALGYMGVAAPLRHHRGRKRLTAMGCSQCRTGLTWLGQDDDTGVDISDAPIATDLTPPPAPDVLTNPAGPGTVLGDVLAIGQASGINTTTGMPLQTQLQPPTGPVLTNMPGQPLPQAQLKAGGSSSTWIYAAAGAAILLAVVAGGR